MDFEKYVQSGENPLTCTHRKVNVDYILFPGPCVGVPSQPKELSLLGVNVQHQGPVQLERPEAHRGEARAPLQPEHEGRGGGLLLGGAEPEEEAAIGRRVDSHQAGVALHLLLITAAVREEA